jgi:transposase IS204/IS1001/IS1096/IS1165 family protein
MLPDRSRLVIEQVSITNEVRVTVRAASPTASCPCCGTISKRVQSRSTRTLRDLPASGRPVELIVCVRRFFCQESTCVRKIFAERFPSLTLPRVKFTLRLQETLRQMGFALGGEAGARLGRQLSIPGSSDTLLRLVKGADLSVASSPRVVGIDDWSWKRRLRYGTLICDLENNTPIDVLPDREVETVSARAREPSYGGNREPRPFLRVRSGNFERGFPSASSRRSLAYWEELVNSVNVRRFLR